MLALATGSLSFVCSPALRPAQTHLPVAMGSTADFKNGLTLEYEGAPWKVRVAVLVGPRLATTGASGCI